MARARPDDEFRWSHSFIPKKVGEGATGPMIPVLAALLGATALTIGLIEFAFSLLAVLGAFVWGRTSDETRKRKAFIVLGFGGAAVAFLGLALARDVLTFAVFRGLQGFMIAAYVAVGGALIADRARPSNLGERMGHLNMVGGAGYCVGLLVGALVVGFMDMRSLFGLAALLTGVSTVLAALLIHEPESTLRRREVHRIFRNVAVPFLMPISRRGFNPLVLFHRPKFTAVERRAWSYLFAIFLCLLAGSATFALFPLYLRDLGASATSIFLIMLGTAVASMLFYRGAGALADRVGYRKVQLAGIGGRGLVFALLAAPFATNLFAIGGLLVANGLAWAVINTTGPAALFRGMEIRAKGELVGLYNIAVGAGQALGAIAGGLVVTFASFRVLFVSSAVVAGLAVLITGRAVYPRGLAAPPISAIRAPTPSVNLVRNAAPRPAVGFVAAGPEAPGPGGEPPGADR